MSQLQLALFTLVFHSALCTAGELDIRPNREAKWDADPENVQAVLESAAKTLIKHFPKRKFKPILIEPRGGPIVLFERAKQGEYQVRLDTGGTYWSQYSFQFAHEVSHILCDYQERRHRNLWFEESICETASLYALREMAKVWKDDPPYENWRDYAPKLAEYAEQRLTDAKAKLDKPLAEWFADHEAELYGNATKRELNLVIASQLLPLFESEPSHWEAVTWLNASKPTESQTLDEFLAAWRSASPERHRAFVAGIENLFIQTEKP